MIGESLRDLLRRHDGVAVADEVARWDADARLRGPGLSHPDAEPLAIRIPTGVWSGVVAEAGRSVADRARVDATAIVTRDYACLAPHAARGLLGENRRAMFEFMEETTQLVPLRRTRPGDAEASIVELLDSTPDGYVDDFTPFEIDGGEAGMRRAIEDVFVTMRREPGALIRGATVFARTGDPATEEDRDFVVAARHPAWDPADHPREEALLRAIVGGCHPRGVEWRVGKMMVVEDVALHCPIRRSARVPRARSFDVHAPPLAGSATIRMVERRDAMARLRDWLSSRGCDPRMADL